MAPRDPDDPILPLRPWAARLGVALCLLGLVRGVWYHFHLEQGVERAVPVEQRFLPAAGVLPARVPLGLLVVNRDPERHQWVYPRARYALAPEPVLADWKGQEYVLAEVDPPERLASEARARGYSVLREVAPGLALCRREPLP